MAYPTNTEVAAILKARGMDFEGFDFFPGTNADVTAEQIADTVMHAIKAVENGNCREIDLDF